ncbi:MAG TPA: response regulator transcription factor [Bacteroidota bacterium]|nr:response regulator transcription factor [Bacteroidota bacterium]
MRKLLIIDDSPLVRDYVAQMISTIPDIELVGEAETVSESIAAIKKLAPDIIILDLQLPDGNGFEILNLAKKILPRTKVIVLTNYPFPQHKARALAAGAEYFFDKSLEFGKVIGVLKQSNNHDVSS